LRRNPLRGSFPRAKLPGHPHPQPVPLTPDLETSAW
jgi:hypothetical protein